MTDADKPDGDAFSNLVELQNSTNPRSYDEEGGQPPEGWPPPGAAPRKK